MDAAYDDQVYVDDRTIDSHIKRCARSSSRPTTISSRSKRFYGVGYRYRET